MGRYFVGCLAILCLGASVYAQSTSPWKKIGSTTIGDDNSPSAGAAYMTVYVRAAAVYQNSNWWTNVVEKNRQAVLTASIEGTVSGAHFADIKVGSPIALAKNDSLVDLGWSGDVVDNLPTTFSGMTFKLRINKTSKDSLNDLISMVSELSTSTPPVVSITQQQMGFISFSKTIADYLFNKNLLVTRLSTESPLPASGLLEPGVYVCFAGDSNADYGKYLGSSRPGLQWDGAQLTYNQLSVQKVSYFIVEVGYRKRFYASPLDALSGIKPWVSLYLLAGAEVPNINSAAEAKKTHDDIQSLLSAARALLDKDSDLLNAEKDEIDKAVYEKIETEYSTRLDRLNIPESAIYPGSSDSLHNHKLGMHPGSQSATPTPLINDHSLLGTQGSDTKGPSESTDKNETKTDPSKGTDQK